MQVTGTIAPQQLHSSLQLVGRLPRQSNAQAHPLRAFSENHSMCININLHLNLAWKYFNETTKSGTGGGINGDDVDDQRMCSLHMQTAADDDDDNTMQTVQRWTCHAYGKCRDTTKNPGARAYV